MTLGSNRSTTGVADSDFNAESCIAESCASFEFVDDERSSLAAVAKSPSEINPETLKNVACSPCTSEIGSVFGLRFDPQENKMTLQLTAAPADARSPVSDCRENGNEPFIAKLQRSPLNCRYHFHVCSFRVLFVC